MSKNETVQEFNRLKRAWKNHNSKCHPEDKITFNEFLDEHSNIKK
jgi:hypothetical protein